MQTCPKHRRPLQIARESILSTSRCFPFPAAIAASITVLLVMCQLSPDYRDDPEASYAEPGIGQEIYSKEGAKYCHADAAGNSYRLADPSLAFQQAPPLVNHQQNGAGIGFI